MTRIPHGGSPVEVRQFAQRMAARVAGGSDPGHTHSIYLLADGSRDLTGNLAVDAAITIDGRDLSVDGVKLDGIEALADVTDVANVAAAGAAMVGGAYHNGFSDFVAAEHVALPAAIASVLTDHNLAAHTALGLFDQHTDVDHNQTTNYAANQHVVLPGLIAAVLTDHNLAAHTALGLFDAHADVDHNQTANYVADQHVAHTGVSIATAATSGISGGGTIAATRNLALNINGLTGESAIVAADTLAFYDATAGANRKVTLTELSTALGAADEKVKVDVGATAGYLGVAAGDGVLRTNAAITWADGGNFVTLSANPGLVDRGNLASWDFEIGDLTMDGTWRDLDFSSVVPVGTYAVFLRFRFIGDNVGDRFSMKTKGYADGINSVTCYAQAAGEWFGLAAMLKVDANYKLIYNGEAGVSDADIAVRGWFI